MQTSEDGYIFPGGGGRRGAASSRPHTPCAPAGRGHRPPPHTAREVRCRCWLLHRKCCALSQGTPAPPRTQLLWNLVGRGRNTSERVLQDKMTQCYANFLVCGTLFNIDRWSWIGELLCFFYQRDSTNTEVPNWNSEAHILPEDICLQRFGKIDNHSQGLQTAGFAQKSRFLASSKISEDLPTRPHRAVTDHVTSSLPPPPPPCNLAL